MATLRRLALVLVLASLATVGHAAGETFLRFDSQPGDYIGEGNEFTLTPSDGTITAAPTAGGIGVRFQGSFQWDLTFGPPAGSSLVPGQYDRATRWPNQAPTSPGLSVYGDGRGCRFVNGRFTVLEVEYGAGGEVLRFAVDYEQHCDGGPALFGSVRINSSVTLGPRLSVSGALVNEGDSGTTNMSFVVSLSAPAPAPVTVGFATTNGTATAGVDYGAVVGTADFPPGVTSFVVNVPAIGDVAVEPDEGFTLSLHDAVSAPIFAGTGTGVIRNDDPYKTFLYFNSQPGDFVGQGNQFTLTAVEGAITATRRTTEEVRVQHQSADSTWWTLRFVPPSGTTLLPGQYEAATRVPFQSPTHPGLDVSGDARGCNILTGRFTVLEAEYGAGGEVLRFAADYEQHCEAGIPALFGSVRINSSLPVGPRVSVSGAAVYEGDTGTANLAFVVSLSAPAAVPVSVGYATADGTALAGSDYGTATGTAAFAPGATTFVVNVPVFGDSAVEPDENLTMSLHTPAGAPVGIGAGAGVIRNDEPYRSFLSFDSQPGDFIGQGRRFRLTPIEGNITADRVSGGVHVHFEAPRWDLRFVPPSGANLLPGQYEGATRYPFQSPATPGLDVTGESRACNTLTGRFTVLEAEYGPDGEVIRFAADYQQHCEGGLPTLFGSVRINSNVAFGPQVSVSGASVYEGDSGTANLVLQIALSAPAPTPVTVAYATSDGTAVAGSDYGAISGTAFIAAGATSFPIVVPVTGDTLVEPDETFTLSLSNPTGAIIGRGTSSVTIRNDDPNKTYLYFDSQPGDYIGGGTRFTLTPVDGAVTTERMHGGVQVRFQGSPSWELWFVPPSGANLLPGQYDNAIRYLGVPTANPGLRVSGAGRGCNQITGRFTVLEADYGPGGEVVRLAVDYEQHCEGGVPALFGSVRINSSVPRLSRLAVSSGAIYEGDAGTVNLSFVISLSAPLPGPVTVAYATVDGTATAGSDYGAVVGTASFAPGATSFLVTVPVAGDTAIEPDETFTMALSNAVGAPIGLPTGTGTIRTDDPSKTLLYFNSEPGDYVGDGRRFTLTPVDGVITTERSSGGVHVEFHGLQHWEFDFVPPSGVSFGPGQYDGATRYPFQSPTTPGMTVAGEGRGCNMLTGRFTVLEAEYAPGGGVLRFALDYEQHCEGWTSALYGSVRINSSVPLPPHVEILGASVAEGDSGTRVLSLPLRLSEASPRSVTVEFTAAGGTAAPGVDYGSYAGSVTIPAGSVVGAIPIPVFGDTLSEEDETIVVSLTGSVGAQLGEVKSAVAVIQDDDPLPALSIEDVTLAEGDPWSPGAAGFRIQLSAVSGRAVSVSYATQQASALTDQDFVVTGGTAQLPPGTTSTTVTIPLVADLIKEADETFQLVLFDPQGASLANDSAVATIRDDDRVLRYHTTDPCRLVDTRSEGPALDAHTARAFGVAGRCGIPSTARAVAINVTSVTPSGPGHFRVYPAGTSAPTTSVLNWVAGQTRAGNAVVALGAGGALAVACDMPDGAADLLIDVFGYFQ